MMQSANLSINGSSFFGFTGTSNWEQTPSIMSLAYILKQQAG